MNQVILIGRAGQDPDFRYVGNGTAIATFSLCTSEPIKGTKDYKSTWQNVKCWAKAAERANNEIRKGDEVFVQGKIEQESWEDKESGEKKYKMVITAFTVRMTAQAGTGKGSDSKDYRDDPGPSESW